jgi:hypothetical protein
MSNPTQRIPIHAGDPDEIFVLEAQLLMEWGAAIEKNVADILEKFPDYASTWSTYIDTIGSNVPDEVIRAAIKRLAISKIRQAGVAI